MLNIFADGGVNVAAGGFIVPEGGVRFQGVLIVKGQLACSERAAVTDVFVNVVNARQTALPPAPGCGSLFHWLLLSAPPQP